MVAVCEADNSTRNKKYYVSIVEHSIFCREETYLHSPIGVKTITSVKPAEANIV